MRRYFVVNDHNQLQDCIHLNLKPMVNLTQYFEHDQIDQGMSLLNQAYQIGCREVICDSMIPQRYLKRVHDLLNQLANYKGLSLTVQDIGIIEQIESLHLSISYHIDLKTGGNNHLVYHFFNRFDGLKTATLSRELNRGQITQYCQQLSGKLRVQILGPLLLMQTARPLLLGIKKSGIEIADQLLLSEPKRPRCYFPLNQGGYSDRFYHMAWIDLRDLIPFFKKHDIEMIIDPRGATENQYQELLASIPQNQPLPETIPTLHAIPEPEPYRRTEQPDGMVIDAIKGEYAILKSERTLKEGMSLKFTRHKGEDLIITVQNLVIINQNIYQIPWQRGIIGGNKFYCISYGI